MTDEKIDRMMGLAARFYWKCPVPFVRSWPVMICAAIAAKEIRKRRLERLKSETEACNQEIA